MTQASPATILEVNNIEVIYNKVVQALRGLSLAVPRGQIVALLGSNGAGKSTTLKAVSGLLALEDGELESGSILFNGQSTAALAPQQLVRSGLSHVMEGRRVFEDLTVEENLVAATYALTGRAGAAQPDFDLVYTYFPRLHERRKGLAGYLSGGEQQMLAIGRALIAQPQLILLDEPSLGLSPKLVEDIFTIIARINGAWNSVVGSDESFLFWQHVRLAGLATGTTNTAVADYIPRNAEGGVIGVTSDPVLTAPATPYPASFYVCSQGIQGRFARQIDTTLDDGNTQTGTIRVITDNAANMADAINVMAANDAVLYTVCMSF